MWQKRTRPILLWLLISFSLVFLAVAPSGSRNHLKIENQGTGVSDWAEGYSGSFNCILLGTFTGASVTVEARVPVGAGFVKPVEVSDFIGATTDTTFIAMSLGTGHAIRLNVAGGTAPVINLSCVRIVP